MTTRPPGDGDRPKETDDSDLSDVLGGGEETRIAGEAAAAGPPAADRPGSGSAMVGTGGKRGGGLWEGDTLKNRFVLEKCLGVGGMGTVFKALDLRKQEAQDRNPYLAVKILNADFRSHPESLRTLQREAKKAQNLSHENIVKVFDFDRDGEQVYMIMEYLDGEALDLRTKQSGFRGMPVEIALRIIADVGAALSYAHENGIVHCDFKPANIILTHDGPAKVIDFGIARAVKRDDTPQKDDTLFDAGDLGAYTLAYASLEILERKDPDPRDDVYALACIAYELITGKHPYNRLSAAQALENKIQPPRPKALSAGQWAALKKGLALKRSQRTKSVKELVEGLSKKGGGAGRKLAVAAGLAAVLIGAGLAAYLFLSPRGPADPNLAVEGSGAPAPEPRPEVEREPQSQQDIVSAETLVDQLNQSEDAPEGGPAQATDQQTAALPGEIEQPPAPSVATLAAADVQPLLSAIDCALLDVQTAEGTAVVSGYARDPAQVAALDGQMRSLPGFSQLRTAVLPLSPSLCGPLAFYKPYDALNRDANFGMKVSGQKPQSVYFEGDTLMVEVAGPPFDSYLYVDYFLQDGSVYHMMPGSTYRDNFASAGHRAVLGTPDSGVTWSISPPYGTEMITIIAAPRQLVGGERPEVENGQAYLSALRSGLEAVYAEGLGNQVAADIYLLTTQAQP